MEFEPSGSKTGQIASIVPRISSTLAGVDCRLSVLRSARTTSSFSKVPEPSSSQYAYHAFLSRLMSGISIVSCRLRKVERT